MTQRSCCDGPEPMAGVLPDPAASWVGHGAEQGGWEHPNSYSCCQHHGTTLRCVPVPLQCVPVPCPPTIYRYLLPIYYSPNHNPSCINYPVFPWGRGGPTTRAAPGVGVCSDIQALSPLVSLPWGVAQKGDKSWLRGDLGPILSQGSSPSPQLPFWGGSHLLSHHWNQHQGWRVR